MSWEDLTTKDPLWIFKAMEMFVADRSDWMSLNTLVRWMTSKAHIYGFRFNSSMEIQAGINALETRKMVRRYDKPGFETMYSPVDRAEIMNDPEAIVPDEWKGVGNLWQN